MSHDVKIGVVTCSLEITKNARKGLEQWFLSEQAFVSSESTFDIYIEKKPANRQGNQSYSLYFDPHTNKKFAKEVQQRVAVMECVLKPDGFVATGFHVRGAKEPVQTNRRLHIAVKFRLNRAGVALPIQFYTRMRELPIAEERSEYVKKRIESWEGYLQIAEKNADVEDISCTFTQSSFTSDFTKLRLHCKDLQTKNWKQLKGFSVKVMELSTEIGQIVDVQKSQNLIVVELNQRFKMRSRQEQWLPKRNKKLVLTNFAELSQIRRLRKGFKDLQDGLAANANLEKILFEERPVVQINNKNPELEFHNNLNEYQREAVTGAMKSHDLYVIQGPPGTGKTTVISEICYQNVKAGLRTLVASQSNLAVDNALGRLLMDPATRILRYGRSESIEEEGKRFIEENVALNWRNETLETVRATRAVYKAKDLEMQERIEQLEQMIKQHKITKCELIEQIDEQNLLQEQLLELKGQFSAKQSTIEQATMQLSEKRQMIQQTEQEMQQLTLEINELHSMLSQLPSEEKVTEQLTVLQSELKTLKEFRIYIEWQENLQKVARTRQNLITERNELPMQENVLHVAYEKIITINKMEALQKVLAEHRVELPIHIILQSNELQRLIKAIETGEFSYEFQEWKELYERFQTAIGKTERLLLIHRYPITTIEKRSTDNFTTVQEMHDMIDRLGRFLVDPATKTALQHSGTSSVKTAVLQKIAQGISLFYGKEEEVRTKGLVIQQQQIQTVKKLFTEVKQNVLQNLKTQQREMQHKIQQFQRQEAELQKQQEEIQQQLDSWLKINDPPDEKWNSEGVTREIHTIETSIFECQQQMQKITQATKTLANKKQQLLLMKLQQEEQLQKSETLEQQRKQLQQENSQLQERMDEIVKLIIPDLERQLSQIVDALRETEKEFQELIKEREQLPVLQELQAQWELLLQEANDYDLDEIRKLYVEHANVIGTTCVASASKKFMEEYPVFDVVIIDEVSKATPPELLLPMLKGKKVILVGDHHQLPPLVGQETMDELVDQQKDPEVQREMKKLLNESLFERLFRTLPKQNKTMLSIQYRMHERIMDTIAPFYKEGNYELQCGLSDSDKMRDHLLESPIISRNDHLLWLDTPNQSPFFEDKVKGGTSRFNESELTVIRDTLVEIEQATELAKAEGRMKAEDKKSVGVISFYGEQVKRIDRLIQQELQPKQLHCRTGSVDKFQGMEMDIIILSFVRNHDHSNGDIGFAKDYRRLNVALSRARELLIIVGSSEMFTVRTKSASTRDMYRQLQNVVEQCGGMKKMEC
ncbi:AAA domain-containing protein [Sporosarcina obsidiansis]|uniref:AAA domain-containing protein n=1 Tax=Sporosarcina obsidiansis TaxID=2660748 RepID=UPI001891A333|nr:AAA domain-containing protein [Sporosarcina obsidiansis]